MTKLLPPNATQMERLAAEAGSTATDLPIIIRALWDPEACPLHLLPYLAWAWSADEWSDEWSERQKRDTVSRSMAVHRIKGTIGAVRSALRALGYPARVQEWFNQTPAGDPHTFRLLLDGDQQPITSADLKKILQVVEATKNLRSHLEQVLLSVASSATLTVATAATVGVSVEPEYRAPRYRNGQPAIDLMTDAALHGAASTTAGISALHHLVHSVMPNNRYW